MSDKLKAFEAELRAEHAALTKAFEASQIQAEAEWAKHMAASDALTAFRAKYHKVLKALDAGAVTVKEN